MSHYPPLGFLLIGKEIEGRFSPVDKNPPSTSLLHQVGMLEKYIKLTEPTLGKTLQAFKAALSKGRFSIRRDLSLVFLCGANQLPLVPSERRRFLKYAIERTLPHSRIVYAEKVMEELSQHGKTKNLLDIEHQISALADWILIVLESYSSFCELGAFAHKEARSKLLVINDSTYKAEPSFINQGPLQAIAEDASKDQVFWYPMHPDGIKRLDSIGSTLPSVISKMKHYKSRDKFHKDDLLSDKANQASLFFLHDLIYLCGPITHAETITLYKAIFGDDGSYDEVKSLRGILHACKFIKTKTTGGTPSYMSTSTETFINFGVHGDHMLSTFRRFHLKFNSQRILNA